MRRQNFLHFFLTNDSKLVGYSVRDATRDRDVCGCIAKILVDMPDFIIYENVIFVVVITISIII